MFRNCILGLLITMSVTAGASTVGNGNFRIDSSQVAAALSRAGMHVKAGQVHLGADVWARSVNPAMDLVSAQALPDKEHAWVRIHCREPRECRPFYAEIAWSGPLPRERDEIRSKVGVHSTTHTHPAIRLGDHATLIVDGPGLHMEIAVVAMQNGAVGQVIQLATPDRKEFFRGEVVNKFRLTGTL